jgi:hypothetical protein
MKPLPAQVPNHSQHPAPSDSRMPPLPEALGTPTLSQLKENRRISTCATHRAYPWLLVASTAIAGLFCLMYITKPVIFAAPTLAPFSVGNSVPPNSPTLPTVAAQPSLMPAMDHLPGEKSSPRLDPALPHEAHPTAQPVAAFEQTNLRVQHILNAQAPGGHLSKIDLDVPVLYQSRNLRWTAAEVAEARELMTRLKDYQEKSRALRSEGADLLAAWNQVVGKSIPAGVLRADSPALPINQQDGADSPRPAGLDTTELIQIQPAKK